MEFTSKLFGVIDVDPQEGLFYPKQIIVNQEMNDCNLFINDDIANNSELVKKALEITDNIDLLNQKAIDTINSKNKNGDKVILDFITFHIEELAVEIKEFSGIEDITPGQFIDELTLCNISIHSEADSFIIVLDYSFDTSMSDEVLAVYFDSKSVITAIEHES